MARSRMTKGAALDALDKLIAEGQRLQQASDPDCAWPNPEEEAHAIASLGVDRLLWAQALRNLFPQMSKGMQLAADFRRASLAESYHPALSLADDRLRLHEGLAVELKVLTAAVDRWRRSGTRPLNEAVLAGAIPTRTGPIGAPGGEGTPPPLEPLPLPPLPPLDEAPPRLPKAPRPATAPIKAPAPAKKAPPTGRITPPR